MNMIKPGDTVYLETEMCGSKVVVPVAYDEIMQMIQGRAQVKRSYTTDKWTSLSKAVAMYYHAIMTGRWSNGKISIGREECVARLRSLLLGEDLSKLTDQAKFKLAALAAQGIEVTHEI